MNSEQLLRDQIAASERTWRFGDVIASDYTLHRFRWHQTGVWDHHPPASQGAAYDTRRIGIGVPTTRYGVYDAPISPQVDDVRWRNVPERVWGVVVGPRCRVAQGVYRYGAWESPNYVSVWCYARCIVVAVDAGNGAPRLVRVDPVHARTPQEATT